MCPIIHGEVLSIANLDIRSDKTKTIIAPGSWHDDGMEYHTIKWAKTAAARTREQLRKATKMKSIRSIMMDYLQHLPRKERYC
jgi:hypothetical protein